jgi:hypothetical protein
MNHAAATNCDGQNSGFPLAAKQPPTLLLTVSGKVGVNQSTPWFKQPNSSLEEKKLTWRARKNLPFERQI